MKKLFLNGICAILLIVAGCSQETLVDEQKVDEQVKGEEPTVITLTAGMPDEGVRTRMGLERENLDIKLTWEAGDQLQLCLKYGDTFEKQVTTVTDISPDGKTAKFPVTLPSGSYTNFDLYGVYGGGGLDNTDPTKAILPSSTASTSGNLDDLKANKTVMLTFAQTGIDRSAPTFSVDLNHVGSLFCIQLRNMSTTVSGDNIKKVRLTAASPIYAHNNAGAATYDLTTGTFTETTSLNTLTFELPSAIDIAPGGFQEFWGWYPPVANQNWPEIKLEVINASDQVLVQSVNSKRARTAATPAGKVFYFPVAYDGSKLFFHTDDIDGNVYMTVVIDNKEWFAENLRTTRYNDGTPIPTGYNNAEWSTLTTGAYAVYPHTSIDGLNSDAEVLDAYGALYNGYAVETGKLCPEGWQVPADAGWTGLTDYLGGVSVAGGKLKSTRTEPVAHPRWDTPNTDATDEYDFSALPGGYRGSDDGEFYRVAKYGNWWSRTESDATNAWSRSMVYDDKNVNRNNSNKRNGFSVRCVSVN